MSNESEAHVYQNVGVFLDPAEEGAAVVYQNVGLQSTSRVGAVYGSSASHLTPLAHVYQNVT